MNANYVKYFKTYKRYRKKNAKIRAAKQREYYRKHTKRILKQHKKYNETHKRSYKQTKKILKKYRVTIKGRFATLKSQAKKKNLKVKLTLEQYAKLISQSCYYCKGPLNETGCGLDRINNSKGYLLNNVVPCCRNCNIMKNSFLTFEEMIVAMKAVLKLRKSKEG